MALLSRTRLRLSSFSWAAGDTVGMASEKCASAIVLLSTIKGVFILELPP